MQHIPKSGVLNEILCPTFFKQYFEFYFNFVCPEEVFSSVKVRDVQMGLQSLATSPGVVCSQTTDLTLKGGAANVCMPLQVVVTDIIATVTSAAVGASAVGDTGSC